MTSAAIEKENLVNAVNASRTAISGKSTIPILNNVMLNFSNERLAVTGTDLDCQVETTAPATIKGDEFSTTVEFSDPRSPIKITDPENGDVSVIMPMNI